MLYLDLQSTVIEYHSKMVSLSMIFAPPVTRGFNFIKETTTQSKATE